MKNTKAKISMEVGAEPGGVIPFEKQKRTWNSLKNEYAVL